jgi:hypothetical protein
MTTQPMNLSHHGVYKLPIALYDGAIAVQGAA